VKVRNESGGGGLGRGNTGAISRALDIFARGVWWKGLWGGVTVKPRLCPLEGGVRLSLLGRRGGGQWVGGDTRSSGVRKGRVNVDVPG